MFTTSHRLLLLAFACSIAHDGYAQNYPARPVRLIVGFAPSGGNDIVARLAAQLGIEMPITQAVDDILHHDVAAAVAVETLLSRDPKAETR